MECSECNRLTDEFGRLERAYATAVGVLTASAHADEYARLRVAADEARIDSEVARLELEQHKRKHAKAN